MLLCTVWLSVQKVQLVIQTEAIIAVSYTSISGRPIYCLTQYFRHCTAHGDHSYYSMRYIFRLALVVPILPTISQWFLYFVR